MNRANKNWTPAEEKYLSDNWGQVSVAGICKHLGRTKNAVMVRVQRLGLPPYLESGDYVTVNQLNKTLFGTNFSSYQLKSWVKDRGFPVHNKRRGNSTYRIVYLEEFWEWAEKNRSFIDFSKMEPLALGAEPGWVAEQRKQDFHGYRLQRKDRWTPEEDQRLVDLLKQYKYGYAELSQMLHRSAGAIQRRCTDLGLKERPVKADNHGDDAKWSDADFEILADGIRRGEGYTSIGLRLGKSEKAIRGKVYFTYLTESADKVRAMMGDGAWGTGAPEPTVKQAVHLSRARTATKAMLEQLCSVLLYRTQELKGGADYDNYFQRAACMKWNERMSVCSAGCDDCDSCPEFARIPPQFCVRCGGTFYERQESKICKSCREARRKQAYRKYNTLSRGRNKTDGERRTDG